MKKNITFRILSCVALALICACTTPFDKLRDYSGQDSGHVVLSLGQPVGSIALTSTLFMRRLGTPDLVEIECAPIKSNAVPDFESQTDSGMVIMKKLPPGEYEIYGFQLGINGDFMTLSGQLSSPVRFSVRQREVSYIGNYSLQLVQQADTTATQKGQVVTVAVSALALKMKMSDAQKRDIKIATTRNTALTNMNVNSYTQATVSAN
jgi:hypothetical protein